MHVLHGLNRPFGHPPNSVSTMKEILNTDPSCWSGLVITALTTDGGRGVSSK